MIHFAMEYAAEHQVPQNVTSFEFHLVGDMTLKQFGYLAAGMIIAYIVFATLLTSSPVVALPIIIFSALSGVALAFFPIADRPLDHWVSTFFRAVYSPTQGRWKSPASSKGKEDLKSPAFQNRLQIYLASIGETSEEPQVSKPAVKQDLPSAAPALQSTKIQAPSPNLPQLNQMAEYIRDLQAKLAQSERQIQELKTVITSPRPQVQGTPAPIQTPRPIPLPKPAHVTVVASKPTIPTQPVLTSQANVINGIITDALGNYMEGAIVSIHDKNNLPVRALKTNKLGQFAGATPLPSGAYTVTFEKENLEFDALQITLNGEVSSPLNVRAKKGGA